MLLRLLLMRNKKIREGMSIRQGERTEASTKKESLRVPSIISQSNVTILKAFAEHLSRYVGETVTIFTGSGGQSGAGFTGVLLYVNNTFLRLITFIGPPPECSLGNSCSNYNYSDLYYLNKANQYNPYPYSYPSRLQFNPGSVADIPISKIVSFSHNTI